MDDLRIKAMDYALAARANAEQDVVALAMRIHTFLAGGVSGAIRGLAAQPPPIPELVQQVRHDADLSQADQSPPPQKYFGPGATLGFPDDDTKTRIISRIFIRG